MPKLISSKLIFIFLLCFSFAFFIHATQAASITFKPQVIGEIFPYEAVGPSSIGILISNIYKYATGVVGILAAVVLMFGGILWLTAGGNPTQIGEAKAWIMGALSGLVIVMTAYLILYVVNPALVTFPELSIKPVNAPKDIPAQALIGRPCATTEGIQGVYNNNGNCTTDNVAQGSVGTSCSTNYNCGSGLACVNNICSQPINISNTSCDGLGCGFRLCVAATSNTPAHCGP